jgi:hypothetical protein
MDGLVEGKGMDCAQAFLVFVLKVLFTDLLDVEFRGSMYSNSSPVAIMGRAKSNHISNLLDSSLLRVWLMWKHVLW